MNKEPFLQVSKRRNKAGWQERLLIRFIALILALIVCGAVIVALVKMNPVDVYKAIWDGAMGSERRIWQTIRDTMVLLCIAIGLAPAFKMKFWNIGAEGQILIGGACSAAVMIYAGDKMSPVILLIVMFIASALGGMIWGMIPAVFKAYWNTNETLFTLMLNYIALYLISFLRDGPWQDPNSSGFPKIAKFGEAAQLDKIFGVHAGWLIGLILVVIVYIYLKYTKQGYEISVVGESRATANYAGMNYKKIVLRTMAFSGGICGIAGMVQASGSDLTLTTSVAGGVGFTAIIVAWLAQLNPVGILVVSFLFAVLEKGSTVMQSAHGLSAYSADVLQGIILFFVLGCEFFVRYKFVTRKKGGKA